MSENGDSGTATRDEMAALEELKDEREVFKEALEEALYRLNELNGTGNVDQELSKEVKELQITIEQSLTEIKDLDVKIQAQVRKLKLRSCLVEEIKRSRAYAAKVQVALNKAAETEKKKFERGIVTGTGGSTRAQREDPRTRQGDMSPAFYFQISHQWSFQVKAQGQVIWIILEKRPTLVRKDGGSSQERMGNKTS